MIFDFLGWISNFPKKNFRKKIFSKKKFLKFFFKSQNFFHSWIPLWMGSILSTNMTPNGHIHEKLPGGGAQKRQKPPQIQKKIGKR